MNLLGKACDKNFWKDVRDKDFYAFFREQVEHCYHEKYESGNEYAYLYPGMNRVLQAAGRVIRRPEDYGVVVLIDDRYAAEPYLSLYPEHWELLSPVEDAPSLYEYLGAFWEGAKEEG